MHAGVAAPVITGQRTLIVKPVFAGVIRHQQPIDAPHIFPPAQDLANEALHRIERRLTLPVSLLGGLTDHQRIQQTNIQIGRQQAVEQGVFPGDHGILEITEVRQPLFDKMCQCLLCLGGGGAPAKICQVADVIGEVLLHQRQHLLVDGIARERKVHGQGHVTLVGLAVAGIKIPLTAHRRIPFHEQAGVATHFPVEELHAQLFLAAGPALEEGRGTEEPTVFQAGDGTGQLLRPLLIDLLLQTVFTAMGNHQLLGLLTERAKHLRQAAMVMLAIGKVIQLPT